MDKATSQLEQQVSALMDGEVDEAALARLEHDPDARAIWLRYHQIGDLLRSPDLQPLPREHDFVRAVSARLEREAPPGRAARRGSARWTGAVAGLAGIAAAVLLTLRMPQEHMPQLAELGQPLQPVAGLMRAGWQASRGSQAPQLLLADAGDTADLTPYLLAHQQLAQAPLGDPEPTMTGMAHAWR